MGLNFKSRKNLPLALRLNHAYMSLSEEEVQEHNKVSVLALETEEMEKRYQAVMYADETVMNINIRAAKHFPHYPVEKGAKK